MKFLTYTILYDLQNPLVLNPKMLKQRRYDQKIKSDIESSKVHNFHKTYLFLLEF